MDFTRKTIKKEKIIMRKFVILTSLAISSVLTAQISSPIPRSSSLTTSNGLKINSRKSILIEKQIFNLGKFKNLNFQKIVSKDMSDNSAENVLGIMIEYETYDNISKKTLTLEKSEVSKLIQSLETLEKKENEKTNIETKYKFVTMSNIEFGSVYDENLKKWTNYIKFPSTMFSQNLNEYTTDELKDLIKILKNAEKEL